MAFFSSLFKTSARTALPSMEALLQARGLPENLPGLEELRKEFQPFSAQEREHWADAVAECQARGWALPPAWLDAQYELTPEIVPFWQAEREGLFFKPWMEGLALRILACGQRMPAPWLAIWGVSATDVLDRAMDQLRERSKGHPFTRLPSGIYQGHFEDGRSASRFLLPELWKDLFPGQNTFVAVPSPDTLLLAPQVLLPKLVEAIGREMGSPTPRLMATIYQQIGEKFMPANLQDPHPIAQPQRELRQADLLDAYRAQEADLPADLGDPAPVGILKTQNGRVVTVTTWHEGRPTLLPETDLVGFIAASGQPLGIYFRTTLPRITEVRGTIVDIWGPRRLRFEAFPTPEQLTRLECFASAEQMAAMIKGNAPAKPAPAAPAPGGSAVTAQASSPLPQHLRGISLGTQDGD